MQMAIKSLRNLKVKDPIDKSQKRRDQTMNFSSKRYLSDLCNKNNGLKIELA